MPQRQQATPRLRHVCAYKQRALISDLYIREGKRQFLREISYYLLGTTASTCFHLLVYY
jgi:hypothetical protein